MREYNIAKRVANYLTHTDVELVFSGNSSAFNDASYEMQKRISNLEKEYDFSSVIMRSDASGSSEISIGISSTENKQPIIDKIAVEAELVASERGLKAELFLD